MTGTELNLGQRKTLKREENKRGDIYQCTKPNKGGQPGEGYEFGKRFCSGPNLGRFQCRDSRDYIKENGKSVLIILLSCFPFLAKLAIVYLHESLSVEHLIDGT